MSMAIPKNIKLPMDMMDLPMTARSPLDDLAGLIYDANGYLASSKNLAKNEN